MHHKAFVGLLYGLQDGLFIQRQQRPQIDYFRFDPFLRQHIRRFERCVHHRGVREDGQVFPFAAHYRFPDRQRVISGGNLSLDAPIQKLVLEKEHGIIVPHGGLQQSLRVIRGRGINHLQPRSVHEIHLRICRMKRSPVHTATRRPAHHHRSRRVPQIMSLGHEIRNLVKRTNDEIDELHFHDGPQPQITHPARRADDGALADRRVNHALPAKPRQQSFAGLERPAVDAHVLAEHDNCRVAFHFFEHRLLDGFEKRDLRSAPGGVLRSGPVRLGHLYLRAFREALAAAAFTVFFAATFAAIFADGFRSLAAFSTAGGASPKWIGAFAPPEPLPDPNPGTAQTAATLDFGGVTSAIGRSHFARILWQSSPVQYTPASASSAGGMGEFSANSRSFASSPPILSSISFLLFASRSFSFVKYFSYSAMGSRASQYARISSGTYSAGSCCAWPSRRNVFASIKIGPSPARARSTASFAVEYIATTSLPSTM